MMDLIKDFLANVEFFFVFYLIGYSTFLFISVVVGASVLYRNRYLEKMKNELKHDYYVPVSVIVPAHNEEVTVVDTVRSLLQLDYKLYEVLVVDDGSTDKTSQRLIKAFNLIETQRPIRLQVPCQKQKAVYEREIHGIRVTLIIKENGGKADALNMGINASRFPYFVCMDADSLLQRDSLEYAVRPLLESDEVIAVGGLVRISNGVTLENGKVKHYHLPFNPLVCMQILEYDRSFLASRILMDQYNGNLIISGAFGLFKKDLVITVGGYDRSTMGEDMELVTKLHVFCRAHDIPYAIRYAPDAICWSQAPSTLLDLTKQRRRWHIGLFQSLTKYRRLFLNFKYGFVSLISYFYYLLYELLSPYIELFGVLTIVLAWVTNLINYPFVVYFYLVYACFSGVLTLVAFFSRIPTQNLTISFSDVVKAVGLCLFEIIFLRLYLAAVRMLSLLSYRKRKNHWEAITRTANNPAVGVKEGGGEE